MCLNYSTKSSRQKSIKLDGLTYKIYGCFQTREGASNKAEGLKLLGGLVKVRLVKNRRNTEDCEWKVYARFI